MAKPAFNKKEDSFQHQMVPRFKEATSKCCIWNKPFYGAGTWTPESRSEISGSF